MNAESEMATSDGLGGSKLKQRVYRVYHAGMHTDYLNEQDVVDAFDSLAPAADLRVICSEAREHRSTINLLNDGSKFLVEFTWEVV